MARDPCNLQQSECMMCYMDVHAGRQVIGLLTVEHDSEKTAANFVHLKLFACVHSDARMQCPE